MDGVETNKRGKKKEPFSRKHISLLFSSFICRRKKSENLIHIHNKSSLPLSLWIIYKHQAQWCLRSETTTSTSTQWHERKTRISFLKHDNFVHFAPLCDSSTSFIRLRHFIVFRVVKRREINSRDMLERRINLRDAGNRIHHARQNVTFSSAPLSLNKHTKSWRNIHPWYRHDKPRCFKWKSFSSRKERKTF